MNKLPDTVPTHQRGLRANAAANGNATLAQLLGSVENDTRESPLLALWQIAMRWRLLIAASVVGAILLGLFATFVAEREYTASTRIQIDRATGNVVNFEGVEPDTRNDWEFYETQYKLLESRSLAEKVVDDLALDSDTTFLSGDDEAAAEDLAELSDAERRDLAVAMVQGGTSIEPVTGSSVVDIVHVSTKPEDAARIANSYAESFIEQNLERRYEATAYARDFLKERLEATRARLEESERAAADYAAREGIVRTSSATDADRRETLTVEKLARLSAELSSATAARVQAQSDFEANRGGRAAASALTNSTISELRRQRSELRGELSKLESDFGPEYPKIKALTAQIAELDVQISGERSLVDRSIESDLRDRYSQALATERSLARQVEDAKNSVLGQQSDEIQFNILERDVATNRALYEGLLQRYKEIGVAGGIGANNVSIVDDAKTPERPSSPNLLKNLFVALVFGAAACGGTIFLLEQIAQSRLRPSDLQEKLGLPLLGSTPRVVESSVDETASKELAEAYFSTLTSIQFSTEQGAPTSLLVTSTQKGEGKSTTAHALAADLAALGSRVILVDGDLRSPSVHKSVGQSLGTGTSDYLANRAPAAELVRESGTKNLAVVHAGTPPPNPAELLAGLRMGQFIDELLTLCDHVVIDGPPILGLADAPLLSRQVEGTVFVVESQRTPAARARLALDRLFAVNARLIGAIITKYDERTGGYGYGYGYGYGSRYKYGS